MPDTQTAGNTSTPATAASAAAPSASSDPATQPAAAPPATAQPIAAAVDPKAAPAPLFTLPEDLKVDPASVSKFDGVLRGKMVDGKLNLTAQEVVDLYADQARDANTRWHAQMVAQDKEWEQQSRTRFTAAQLAAAETGVGFLTSRQLANAEKAGIKDSVPFRDLAKQFRNNPDFVEVMRIVGESLAEDTFEKGAAPAPARKSAAERLYPSVKPS
ncbi:MAG: hypothetical protein JWO52_7845 [Gammaproteobacteria bacterium]|nr:hypothetical protein [Gammaproteobacteria bacterium]